MRRDTPFSHLPFPKTYDGVARLEGSGTKARRTIQNEQNAARHADYLEMQAAQLINLWADRRDAWEKAGNKPLPAGVPLLLKIDDDFELDRLRSGFGFEVVSEQEDGFVIVLSQETDLHNFLEKVNDFRHDIYGSKGAAAVHELRDDNDRLSRILSPSLYEQWPRIDDGQIYTVDVSILSDDETFRLPSSPRKGKREKDVAFEQRVAAWERDKDAAIQAYDQLRIAREDSLVDLVMKGYGGTIGSMVDGVANLEYLDVAGTFSARVTISGKGLRDLAFNLPHLMEITEPDEVELLETSANAAVTHSAPPLTLKPPPDHAPAVCLIDSGIQEMHRLLSPAVDSVSSCSFLPGRPSTDVADRFTSGGHGTRVAGAVVYQSNIPVFGEHQLPFWLQNARVLDDNAKLPSNLFPPSYLTRVVDKFLRSTKKTRIYNHSINGAFPCRTRHMSAWASMMDTLSHERDVLFIQSAGNLSLSSSLSNSPGVKEHLGAGRSYPEYLLLDSCRIANPAQSLQAITVGSIAGDPMSDWPKRSMAEDYAYPSAFSRTGLGMWRCIKPDVVEFGGDFAMDNSTPPLLTTPPGVCPELVRSTLGSSPGPQKDRDTVGTSFAAPKVAHIAAAVQQLFPQETTLLYRALIAQSAQWPSWAQASARPGDIFKVLRHIGYGMPSLTRATENDEYRVTFITNGPQFLRAKKAQVFEIPIPPEIRDRSECEVRIDVTLSYSARPKRTRRRIRGYLSTWLDWDTSGKFETRERFLSRVLLGHGENLSRQDQIPWTLGKSHQYGKVRDTGRNYGTLQKDWAVVNAYELPEVFCLAVVGHEGWSGESQDQAKYALAITFEAINKDVKVYEAIETVVKNAIEVEEQERILQQTFAQVEIAIE